MKAKYHKGPLVTSVPEFVAGIYQGHWFFLNDKPQNIGWLQNMSLRTLAHFVNHQRVWYAIKAVEVAAMQ